MWVGAHGLMSSSVCLAVGRGVLCLLKPAQACVSPPRTALLRGSLLVLSKGFEGLMTFAKLTHQTH